MNRLPLHSSLHGWFEKSFFTTSEKKVMVLTKMKICERETDKKLESKNKFIIVTHSNFRVISFSFFLMIGIICFAQNLSSAYPCVFGLKNIVKASTKNENLEIITIKMKILSRITNAILLYNGFHKKSLTMKKVITEALDVGEPYLLESIEKMAVEDGINAIKKMDALATQSNNALANFTEHFDKLGFRMNTTIPDSRHLFFFDTSNFHFGKVPEMTEKMNIGLDLLIKGIKSPDTKDIRKLLEGFQRPFMLYEHLLKKSNPKIDIEHFVKYWENARPFILDIDFYQLITNQTYSIRLIKTIESLQSSATFIEILSNCEQNKSVLEKFEAINTLVNTTIKISEKHALVGFPQGSEDVKLLLRDFDNEFLKKMLNNGNSLNDLKNLLIPVTSLRTQIEKLENVWAEPARKMYSHLIQKQMKQFKNMCNNTKLILNSLANVKTALVNLTPIAGLNNTVLAEFKNVLNSSILFTNFSNELKSSLKLGHSAKFELATLLKKPNANRSDIENYTKGLRIAFLTNKFEPYSHLLATQFKLLENQRTQIIKLLSRAADLKNTLTDETLLKISEILPENMKLDIKAIKDRIQVLSSMRPLTTTERSGLDQLAHLLLTAKKKMDERRKVEDKIKKEIVQINGFHRLKNFPFAYETTFQLVCFYRALLLLLKPNFCQMSNNFMESSRMLYKKINSLPLLEKEFIGVGWNHLRTINRTFSIFLSEVDVLTARTPKEEQSLKSFGSFLYSLDHVNVSLLNFPLMFRSLDILKTTSIGQTLEVANFEKSLEQMKDLQYWGLRKKGLLSMLLGQVDSFFQLFFSKHLKPKTNRLPLLLVITFVIAIIFVLVSLFVWCRAIGIGGRNCNQDKTNHETHSSV